MIFRSFAILCITAFFTLNAHAGTITINPISKGTFVIQGNSMNGVGGIDIKIKYDQSILASPTVTQGSLISGAMMAANTTIPGSIHIAVVGTTPLSGAGQVATISFASSKATGGIISINAYTIDTAGKGLPTQGMITHPGIPFSDSKTGGDGGKAGDTTPPSPSPAPTPIQATPVTPVIVTPPASVQQPSPLTGRPATTGTYGGTVSMPAEVSTENMTTPKETRPAPDSDPLPDSSTSGKSEPPLQEKKQPVEAEESSSPSTTIHKGVLELFRSFTGKKVPASYKALFDKEISSAIRQNPGIAISDGTTPLTIVANLKGSPKVSPNFALNGAKLVSITKSGDAWTIVAIPRANALQASLTILSGATLIEYPLTLVPPASVTSSAEADFVSFLKDSGVTPPKHDLNGDGVHNYQDDYIYTAHFLIRKPAVDKKISK